MIKKFLSLIICFTIFFQTTAIGSDDWVNVSNSKGKSIDLNMSNIAIFDNYISLFAKAKVKNDEFIYNFFVNTKNKTIYINDMKKINNKKEEKIMLKESEKYLPVNPDSLNECIILYIDENTKYDIRRQNWEDWLKYNISVMKKFNKEWNPNKLKNRYEYRIYLTCELKIDKKGNIIEYKIDMPKSENFGFMIDIINNDPEIINSVERTIKKIKKFDKLPKKFKGDFIVVKLALIYKYYKSEKKDKISDPDEFGYKNLYIHKIKNKENNKNNKSYGISGFEIKYNLKKVGKFIGETILVILFIPFAFLIALLSG